MKAILSRGVRVMCVGTGMLFFFYNKILNVILFLKNLIIIRESKYFKKITKYFFSLSLSLSLSLSPHLQHFTLLNIRRPRARVCVCVCYFLSPCYNSFLQLENSSSISPPCCSFARIIAFSLSYCINLTYSLNFI